MENNDGIPEDLESEETMDFVPVYGRPSRTIKPPIWHSDYVIAPKQNPTGHSVYPIFNHISYNHMSPSYGPYVRCLLAVVKPKNFEEVSHDRLWIEAMQKEIDTENYT